MLLLQKIESLFVSLILGVLNTNIINERKMIRYTKLLFLFVVVLLLFTTATTTVDAKRKPSSGKNKNKNKNIPGGTASPNKNTKQGSILQLRFAWAPIFCYAGSSNGVPKEFCGQDPTTARQRVQLFRQSIIRPLGSSKSCSAPPSTYSASAITGDLRQNLHCTSNSYTEGNDDGWHERVWNEGAGCAAKALGMTTPTEIFTLMSDLFRKYNPDVALKKSGNIVLSDMDQIDIKTLLKVLKKGLGRAGFLTCDGATGTRLSTYSICISTKTRSITNCPKSLIQKKACKSSVVKIERGNGSLGKPNESDCVPYYPSLA